MSEPSSKGPVGSEAVLFVEVIAPAAQAWSGHAAFCVAPGAGGQVGVLPGHAPLAMLLGAGSVRVTELERLTTHRDRLEHEQDRHMQAHYADAVPLPVLRREQDRILGAAWTGVSTPTTATTPAPAPTSTTPSAS